MSIALMNAVRRIPALTHEEAADPYLALTKLTPAEKSFLIHVASYGDENGHDIYPLIKNLADRAGKSERQSKELLKKIRQKGYLVVIEDHTRRSVHYDIPFDVFGDIAPRSPVFSEEDIAEIESKQQRAAAKRLQATIAYFLRAVEAGELTEDQWAQLEEHGIGRLQFAQESAQDDTRAASSRQQLVALVPTAAARGEELASEEEPFLDVEEDKGQQPPAVASVSAGTRLLQLVGRAPAAAASRERDYVMPLASGMAGSSLSQSLPTTPLPGAIIVDAIPSPQPGGAGEELTTADPLSPLEQEIADLEQQEKDAVWDLSWRYPNKIDKRRREVEEDLRAIRSQLTLFRQELRYQQESERQAAADQQQSEVMI